jgi:hypothetical protein
MYRLSGNDAAVQSDSQWGQRSPSIFKIIVLSDGGGNTDHDPWTAVLKSYWSKSHHHPPIESGSINSTEQETVGEQP